MRLSVGFPLPAWLGDDGAGFHRVFRLNQHRAVCMGSCSDDNGPARGEGDDDELAEEFVPAVRAWIHFCFSFAAGTESKPQEKRRPASAGQIGYFEDATDEKFVSFGRH